MNNSTFSNAAPTRNNSNATSTSSDLHDDFTVDDLINSIHELRDHTLQVELNVEYFRLLNAETNGGRRAAWNRLKALKKEQRRMALNS